MPDREWTGSVAVLPASMRELAIDFANRAYAARDEADGPNELATLRALAAYVQDNAYTLGEWSDAIDELYARLDAGEPYTNAQGVALVRRLSEHTQRVTITLRPSDLPDGYLLVHMEDYVGVGQARSFVCGIAPDGRVSS